MNMLVRPRLVKAAASAALLLAFTSCSSTQGASEMSRAKLYPSVAALAKDSASIVVGRVEEQRVANDVSPDLDFTISRVTVNQVGRSVDGLQPGSKMEVRQTGSKAQRAPAQLMEVGASYLLFLTPSGLSGDLASQYYVTGANAGLYIADATAGKMPGPGSKFRQLQRQEGENLPAQLALSEVTG